MKSGDAVAVGYNGIAIQEWANSKIRPTILPIKLQDGQHRLSEVLGGDGSPVFSPRGYFIGITLGKKVIASDELLNLFGKEKKR